MDGKDAGDGAEEQPYRALRSGSKIVIGEGGHLLGALGEFSQILLLVLAGVGLRDATEQIDCADARIL